MNHSCSNCGAPPGSAKQDGRCRYCGTSAPISSAKTLSILEALRALTVEIETFNPFDKVSADASTERVKAIGARFPYMGATIRDEYHRKAGHEHPSHAAETEA